VDQPFELGWNLIAQDEGFSIIIDVKQFGTRGGAPGVALAPVLIDSDPHDDLLAFSCVRTAGAPAFQTPPRRGTRAVAATLANGVR
jgi:hypothetical protein